MDSRKINVKYINSIFYVEVELYKNNNIIKDARPNTKDDELFGCRCDSCSTSLCKQCANISTMEVQAISLGQE